MASKKQKPAEPAIVPGDAAAHNLEAIDIGRQAYKSADSALELVIKAARTSDCPECGAPRFKHGGVVTATDGRKFRIVDKFKNRNSVPVGQNARRFELEPIA